MIVRAFMVTVLTVVVGATFALRPLQVSNFAGTESAVYDSRIRSTDPGAPENGLPVQRNTILILFRDGAPREEIDSLLRAFDLTPRARMEAPLLYVVESSPDDARTGKEEAERLANLVRQLKNHEPLVIEAVQNSYLGAAIVPRNNRDEPRLIWEWHAGPTRNGVVPLREMYFPQAWNLRKAMRHPNKIGMLDIGFDFGPVKHADLTFTPLADLDCIPRQDGHGQAVGGIIAAQFNNTTGIDGASPFAELVVCVARSGTGTQLTSTNAAESEVLDEINSFSSHLHGLKLLLDAGLRVINVSMAYNWYESDLVADGNPLIEDLVEAQGVMVRALLKTYPDSILVTAAGNECTKLAQASPPPPCTRDAKWASPLNWAALGPPIPDRAKNVIVVEAFGINKRILPLSNVNGTIAAIGQQAGTTFTGNGYGICTASTSCATPFVTATISMMLAYEPHLSVAQIRQNLLQSTGSGRLLNAFIAVAASHPDAATHLADLDGNESVDLLDFEMFRKAFRQVDARAVGDDLNEDGTPDLNDSRFPRADLNGDGQISATATSFVPNVGNVTDLGVMMHVWTDTSVDKSTLPAKLLE